MKQFLQGVSIGALVAAFVLAAYGLVAFTLWAVGFAVVCQLIVISINLPQGFNRGGAD